MRRCWYLVAAGVLLTACDAAEDVDVLPLPALERPSPEARLGLPELGGEWGFAGWEIESGDSTILERTFPSFGQLSIQTQRLDSIAGVFQIGGSNVPVIGDVRRDGHLALVTIRGGAPANYLAGIWARDTVWLEVTSILAPDEWPQNARAAFVRQPAEEPYAWLRGQRVDEEPVDTVAAMADSTFADSLSTLPGTPDGAGAPTTPARSGGVPGGPQPVTVPAPSDGAAAPRPGAGGAAPSQPAPSQPTPTPARTQAPPSQPAPRQPPPSQPAPSQPEPAQPQPTPSQPPPSDAQDDEPEPQPDPEIEVPEPDIPDLLGAPVDQ